MANAPKLTAAIVGTAIASVRPGSAAVMPADTRPTIRPEPSRTGTIARIDGPSVPVYTSVNVSPRSAGSMVPMYFPPI